MTLLDVFTLADRVLVLESGTIAEIGSVASMLPHPQSFRARIAGSTLHNHWSGRLAHPVRRPLVRGTGPGLPTGYEASGKTADGGGGVVWNRRTEARAQYHRADGGEVDTRGPMVLAGMISLRAFRLAACITVDATELRVAPDRARGFSVKAQEVAPHPAPHQHASS